MKKVFFIINPISGGLVKDKIPQWIDCYLSKSNFSTKIHFTQYALHAKELATQAIKEESDIVVAVGGDGTINEIASVLVGTNITLALVPQGSGNGLARHLSIPLSPKKAIIGINKGKFASIDVGIINHRYFFCTSGLGFDALVAEKFSQLTKRGFIGYLRTSLSAFFSYQAKKYTIEINGERISTEALLISFANATQFGNNAHIAPLADISDGLIDVSILRAFKWWEGIYLGYCLFNQQLHKTNFVKIFKATEVKILNTGRLSIHIDGEPSTIAGNLKVGIIKSGLKVMIPI